MPPPTSSHTKEKPFACPCGRSFARNDLLKRHRLRAHASVGQSSAVLRSARESNGDGRGQVAAGNAQEAVESPVDLLQNFVEFIDSIGLAPDWESLDFFDLGPTSPQPEPSNQQSVIDPSFQLPEPHINEPSSNPTAAALTSVAGTAAGSEHAFTPIQWRLTEKQWRTIAGKVSECQELLNGFTLPSRHAMSRYLQSYADQFHKHYPVMHLPTFCPAAAPLCLTLAMAAIGAQYRLEPKNGEPLYRAARALILERRKTESPHNTHALPEQDRTARIQTTLLLMAYGAWDRQTELLQSALDLQVIAFESIRSSLRDGLPIDDSDLRWEGWVCAETHGRAILITYAYLVIQSTAYHLPPAIMCSEVQHLQLPCGSSVWEARDAQEWKDAFHRSKHTSPRFSDALDHLLGLSTSGRDATLSFSAMGGFIVLQALIQRIFLTRQIHTSSSIALPPAELHILQRALTRWQSICQQTPNSSLDPRNADGPVPFTSAAFLALALARLHVDSGPTRELHTRDPQQVAAALLSTPTPECSPQAIPALLHAAHSLSVPVQMGVDYVSGSQTLFWNSEHALCGLESGVFLWRWLQSAGDSLTWDDLDSDEKGIISWVLFSISETLQSVEASDLGLRPDAVLSELSFPKLGILVLKIWARVFSSNPTWAIANEIGMSLKLLAEAVEAG